MKKYFTVLLIILFFSCQEKTNNTHKLIDPCEKYNAYHDTLKKFIADFRHGKDHYLGRGITDSPVMDFYFVENHQKWNWLPYPLDHNFNEVKDNIKALIDTLNNCNCNITKSTEFALEAIRHIELDEKDIEQNKQNEIQKGEDLNLSGINVLEQKVTYDENMNPKLDAEIRNETNLTIKSIEIYIKYCDNYTNSASNKFAPSCYQLVLLKTLIKPFSKLPFNVLLDRNKVENASQKLEVGVSKIVNQNGDMTKKFISYYFE